MERNEKLEAALRYAQQGFLVLPAHSVVDGACTCPSGETCKNAGKHPRTLNGLKDATNDETTLRTWWEEWPDANVGVRTGEDSHVIILDVDNKLNKEGVRENGFDELKKLGFTLDDFKHVNRSGSGGVHIFFRYPGKDLRNRQKMRPGLDLRASGGYAIMPPSVHKSGKQYEEVRNDGPQEIPPALLDLFRENERKDIEAPTAKEALLKPASRDNFLMSRAGVMRSKGFSEKEIKAALLVTNSMFEKPKAQADVARIARNITKYPRGGRNASEVLQAICAQSTLVFNLFDDSEYALVNFDTGTVYQYDLEAIKRALRDGFKPFIDNQSIQAEFRYEPHGSGPLYENDIGLPVFNTYIPPDWKRDNFYHETPIEPVATMPTMYDNFFSHLVNNDQKSKAYLLDWLATSMHGRNLTYLTAIGRPGIGKGTLGEIMLMLHGEHNHARVRDRVFKSQFNGRLANRTLVYVDEADLQTKESQDRIKDVANSKIEIERKGMEAEEVVNHASLYLSSNHMDAVKIEPGDRRFSVIELTDKNVLDAGIDTEILKEPDNVALLARYMYFRAITNDMRRPCRSQRFEDVKAAGLSEWQKVMIEDWAPKNVGKEITLKDFQDAVRAECSWMRERPGRDKVRGLCDLYPDVMRCYNHNNEWLVQVHVPKEAPRRATRH